MSTSDSISSHPSGTAEEVRRPSAQPYPGRLRPAAELHGEVQPGGGLALEHRHHEEVVQDERRDRVRWGPAWAGLVVALSTFLLLELAFLALGWLTLGQDAPGTTAGWVSGLIGLFAFFLGGLVAGATAMWRGAGDGLLHGILVWALGVVGIVFLTLFGGGALFGSLADVFTQVASLQQANLPDVQASEALDAARSAASWAILGLGLSVVSAAVGGLAGVKMWPRGRGSEARTSAVR